MSRLLQLEIQLKNESTRPIMHLVDVNGSDVSGITHTAHHLNNALVAHNVSKGTQYYWTLPKEFLGNKVKILFPFYHSVASEKYFALNFSMVSSGQRRSLC